MTSTIHHWSDSLYRDRVAELEGKLRDAKQRRKSLRAAGRAALGLGGVVLVLVYFFQPTLPVTLAVVCCFAVALLRVNYQVGLLSERMATMRRHIDINRWGIARRSRDWDSLPEFEPEAAVAELPLAIDLDLFGHASLMQQLSTAETDEGVSTLQNWLIQPGSPAEIELRQQRCQTLAALIDWRQELQAYCITIADHADQMTRFKQWATNSSVSKLPSIVRGYTVSLRILVPLILLIFLAFPSIAAVLLVIIVVVNLVLTIGYSGNVQSFFRAILVTPEASSQRFLSDTFTHLANCGELAQSMPDAVATSQQAGQELRRLERILRLESISRHPLTVWFFYIPLQLLTLWDEQAFVMAQNWHRTTGQHAQRWFDVLGEVEAICSLANLHCEQPEWAFAKLTESTEPRFVAEELGHPLLADEVRVPNDVTVGPPGSMMLITGSNMGGKSTLLRAIGVNAILAQAGAPCCCQSLSMSPLKVMTNVRMSDSLSDSTSLFMAQLLNLKRIVDHLRQAGDGQHGTAVMYLFDEILNGTNTTDRRLAVESLVAYLIRCRTIGAMTTHDLEIAKESRFKDSFDMHYLGHQLVGDQANPEIKYDYQLRPGVASSRNALLLLRMLGLSD